MERTTASTKERSPDGPWLPNQNRILININVLIYKTWKKYNEIQLTKTKWTWIIEKWLIIHPPGLTVARMYRPPESQLPEAAS